MAAATLGLQGVLQGVLYTSTGSRIRLAEGSGLKTLDPLHSLGHAKLGGRAGYQNEA
jgi:hypothetical protein